MSRSKIDGSYDVGPTLIMCCCSMSLEMKVPQILTETSQGNTDGLMITHVCKDTFTSLFVLMSSGFLVLMAHCISWAQ